MVFPPMKQDLEPLNKTHIEAAMGSPRADPSIFAFTQPTVGWWLLIDF